MILLNSVLRRHLWVKMTVEKTVKTASDAKSKTKCWFWLIFTCWSSTCAYLVHLIEQRSFNCDFVNMVAQNKVQRRKGTNKMTEFTFNALAFLFSFDYGLYHPYVCYVIFECTLNALAFLFFFLILVYITLTCFMVFFANSKKIFWYLKLLFCLWKK